MKQIIAVIIGCLLMIGLIVNSGCQSTGSDPTSPPGVTQPGNITDYTKLPELEKGTTEIAATKILQEKLGLTPDGDFGEVTERAVIQFQASKGLSLKYPGTVGQKTWAALFGATPVVTPSPEPTSPGKVEIPDVSGVPKLGWDDNAKCKYGDCKAWGKYIYGRITGDLWSKFSKMTDGKRLCKNYDALNKEQKGWVLSEMLVWTIFYESAWDPTSRMFENTMGYYSEGLLQLSYPDQAWAKRYGCQFDKKGDDAKYPNDPTNKGRSILNPLINLECGLGIMGEQIEDKGKLILVNGVYWSVLRDKPSSTVHKIIAQTQKLPVCQ